MHKVATPVVYGTSLWARVDGKLYLIGTPVSRHKVIAPMTLTIRNTNIVVHFPLLRLVN
jgi:hypothetical protein